MVVNYSFVAGRPLIIMHVLERESLQSLYSHLSGSQVPVEAECCYLLNNVATRILNKLYLREICMYIETFIPNLKFNNLIIEICMFIQTEGHGLIDTAID